MRTLQRKRIKNAVACARKLPTEIAERVAGVVMYAVWWTLAQIDG